MATPPAIRQATNAAKEPAHPGEHGRGGEEERGSQQEPLAAEPIAERTGDERADQAAQQRAGVRPSDLGRRGEIEALLEERLRAADDHPVIAEEQAAHGRDERDGPDVAEVVTGRHRYSEMASNMARRFSIGVAAWTLWIEVKTNPPPGANVSIRLAHLVAHLLRAAERQRLLRVHAAAPEHEPAAESPLQLGRVHPARRALHRVEDVESGLDDRLEQRLDAAAAVHERLPGRVGVDPPVHPLLVRQIEGAVRLRAAERPVLRAEVGAVRLDDGGAIADRGVEAREVRDRHLGLALEHRVDVGRARDRADVPLLDVADPARAPHPGARHQRDVAERQPAETAEQRPVRRLPQVFGQRAVVGESRRRRPA